MQRHIRTPRPNWEQTVQDQGLAFYLTNGRPYWDETVCYEFSSAQIDALEGATYELDRMCLQAVEHVVTNHRWDEFGIPPAFHRFVAESWERDEHTIYGRFDLSFDGQSINLLEYNADTPTGLIEAAVVQWFWLQDCFPGHDFDQFNSLHERLIEAFAALRPALKGTLYFASLFDPDEDFLTTSYLRDTAMQAGLSTAWIEMGDVGWHRFSRCFVDKKGAAMEHVWKLYPWEWMLRESFGQFLPQAGTRWLEAPWKMILSNKAILPVLWELFPDSPLLLRAEREPWSDSHVRKPLLGREGANLRIVRDGQVLHETDGPYQGPFIYQQEAPLPDFDGNFPVLGSWMVNGHACGLGIREENHRITTNQSRFVPHFFRRDEA